ncbi:MAG: kinase [Halothiobacillus sp.]|nr:kinase [Halothiobacillus sp.]
MANSTKPIVRLTTSDGRPVEYVDEIKAQGGMKDVYFSPHLDYVVAFFREKPTSALKDRIAVITSTYRDRIFNQLGGSYWESVYCWPTGMVEHEGRVGVVVPIYRAEFFFEHGSKKNDMLDIKGKEKEGKWFASANNRSRFLDPRELGDWSLHLKLGIQIARAVRRMHSAGLAHSDLSYKNVLIDPSRGRACLIDIDGLVVPGKYPPDVVGTPDFIAPECVMTSHVNKDDPNRKLPSIATDQHALAVLIYMYLLYRHPLRGDKVHDLDDPQKDEELTMGANALFIEHPGDSSNRIKYANAKPSELPWKDTGKMPYSLTGPYLAKMFKRAFIDGLHNPTARPTADEWENALVKTVDLIQPCHNIRCEQKWYVFDNTREPKCPFCGTPFQGKLPVLNLYSSRTAGTFYSDNHRLMVYSNQSFFPWHLNRNIFPNEKLTDEQKNRVGYFVFHNEAWYLVNENIPDLEDKTDPAKTNPIPIGGKIELRDGQKLLLSKEHGGRLVIVQMVDA